jgi:UDP-GlcNAc3NAcA epimerase
MILTDSGGMQKEAFFLSVPCITVRPETEWIETVAAGWNIVVGTDKNKIIEAVHKTTWPKHQKKIFGDGDAAESIVKTILNLKCEKSP